MSDNDYYERPCHRDPKGARSAATLRELNMKLRAENERLREALSKAAADLESWGAYVKAQKARAACVGGQGMSVSQAVYESLTARVAELEAELALLRAENREHRQMLRAFAALEDKG